MVKPHVVKIPTDRLLTPEEHLHRMRNWFREEVVSYWKGMVWGVMVALAAAMFVISLVVDVQLSELFVAGIATLVIAIASTHPRPPNAKEAAIARKWAVRSKGVVTDQAANSVVNFRSTTRNDK